MDHFESLVHTILEADGYWVRASYRVNLSIEEKRATGKPNIPRPEIDLLAFNVQRNELVLWEVKSYLDSPGVRIADMSRVFDVAEGPLKIFTCQIYRDIVIACLRRQLIGHGAINENTTIRLGLAAGKIYGNRVDEMRILLIDRGVYFMSPEEIRSKVEGLADAPYSNNPVAITSKILRR